jgi:hypothetical protein
MTAKIIHLWAEKLKREVREAAKSGAPIDDGKKMIFEAIHLSSKDRELLLAFQDDTKNLFIKG